MDFCQTSPLSTGLSNTPYHHCQNTDTHEQLLVISHPLHTLKRLGGGQLRAQRDILVIRFWGHVIPSVSGLLLIWTNLIYQRCYFASRSSIALSYRSNLQQARSKTGAYSCFDRVFARDRVFQFIPLLILHFGIFYSIIK